MLQPEDIQIATVDEDFAIDSSAAGCHSTWQCKLARSAHRKCRADAGGRRARHSRQPFPFGAARLPSARWSYVSLYPRCAWKSVRAPRACCRGYISQVHSEVAETVAWLKQECCVDDSGAEQMIGYIAAGRAVLGAVPALDTIIAERFFDEGGGMQLILHAPFGGRINKAWGLALRKRFCRGFNFELQAAATDNGLNISLAEQHSFPLSDVFDFLTEQTVSELLQQASLTSPIFKARLALGRRPQSTTVAVL